MKKKMMRAVGVVPHKKEVALLEHEAPEITAPTQIRVQTLDQGFVEEGKENHRQTIVYSCDFVFLNEALKVDPRVGLFLPCRITVVQQTDKVLVMSINPKRLSRIFNNAELNELCEQMYKVYVEILEESVL